MTWQKCVYVWHIVLCVHMSPCLLFFSSLPLSFLCTSVHPHFPLCARECFVYFRELEAQVTFSRRKQCGGIPGNFLPLVSFNTEVYISQNQSGLCSSTTCSLSLSCSLFVSVSNLGVNLAFNDGYILFLHTGLTEASCHTFCLISQGNSQGLFF